MSYPDLIKRFESLITVKENPVERKGCGDSLFWSQIGRMDRMDRPGLNQRSPKPLFGLDLPGRFHSALPHAISIQRHKRVIGPFGQTQYAVQIIG